MQDRSSWFARKKFRNKYKKPLGSKVGVISRKRTLFRRVDGRSI